MPGEVPPLGSREVFIAVDCNVCARAWAGEASAVASATCYVVAFICEVVNMARTRLSKAEARILEQYWKLGTSSVREILESLPEEERVAYTTVQTLVYRLEQKGALRRVKRIGNAQLFQPSLSRSQHRSRLV